MVIAGTTGEGATLEQEEYRELWTAAVQQVMAERNRAIGMACRARELAKPDAATAVADHCLELLDVDSLDVGSLDVESSVEQR